MAFLQFAGSVGSGARRAGAALWRDTRGGAAAEYSMVALPFLALLTGVLYLMLNYLAQQGLETASESAARILLTGAAQSANVPGANGTTHNAMTASDFKNTICYGGTVTNSSGASVTFQKALPPFLTCNNLTVNVAVIRSYSKSNLATAFAGTNPGTYTPISSSGGQNQIVVLQLIYAWNTFGGLMGASFNGNLLATQVFTTESYDCNSGQTSC